MDRQVVDYLEHDPADYALRMRLAGWFPLGETAGKRFKDRKFNQSAIKKEAEKIVCPYGIDVKRKTSLALAKLSKEKQGTKRASEL